MPNVDRQPKGLTRRDFLKVAGVATAGALLSDIGRRVVLANHELQEFQPIRCEIPPGTGFYAPAASPDGQKVIATIYGNGHWYGFGELNLVTRTFRHVSQIGKDPVYTPDGNGYLGENSNNRNIIFITTNGIPTLFAENAQFPEVVGNDVSYLQINPNSLQELVILKNPDFQKLGNDVSELAAKLEAELGENPRQILAAIAQGSEDLLNRLKQKLPDVDLSNLELPNLNLRDIVPDRIEELVGVRKVLTLPEDIGTIRFYDWRADGAFVAISSIDSTGQDQIRILDSKGKDHGSLFVNNNNINMSYPAWSPSGNRFAYVATPTDADETWNTIILKDGKFEHEVPQTHDPVWLTNDILIGKTPDNDLVRVEVTRTGFQKGQLTQRDFVEPTPEGPGITAEELFSN